MQVFGQVVELKSISLTSFPLGSKLPTAAKDNKELDAKAIAVNSKTCETIVDFIARFPLNFIWLIKAETSWPTHLSISRISTSTFQSSGNYQSPKAQSAVQNLVHLHLSAAIALVQSLVHHSVHRTG